MAMSPRRYAAIQNMATMGSGQEAQTAASMLARQPIGARTTGIARSTGAMRGSIGGGVRAGTPARLPIRGELGMGGGGKRAIKTTRRSAVIKAAPKATEAAQEAATIGGGEAVKSAEKLAKGKNVERLMTSIKGNKKAYAIGAGVIGLGALLGNRRNRGTSSGAQGAYR